MADKTETATPELDVTGMTAAPPKRSEWRRFSRVFFGRKLYLIGFILVVIISPHYWRPTDR
jgi:hypothetical protein